MRRYFKWVPALLAAAIMVLSGAQVAQAGAVVFYAKGLTGGTGDSVDQKDGASLNDGDLIIAVDPTTEKVYHYQLDADSGLTENSPWVISPDSNAGTKRWIWIPAAASSAGAGATSISGLRFEVDPNDVNHDIYIYPGEAVDSTGAVTITLSSTLNKEIDSAWAAGNDGGMFTGTVAADTPYSLCLIYDEDTQTTDAGYDVGADGDCSNMPGSYEYYRWIGFVTTNSSAHQNRWYWVGGSGESGELMFRRWTQMLILDASNVTTSFANYDVSGVLPTSTGFIDAVYLGCKSTDDDQDELLASYNGTYGAASMWCDRSGNWSETDVNNISEWNKKHGGYVRVFGDDINLKVFDATESISLGVYGVKFHR